MLIFLLFHFFSEGEETFLPGLVCYYSSDGPRLFFSPTNLNKKHNSKCYFVNEMKWLSRCNTKTNSHSDKQLLVPVKSGQHNRGAKCWQLCHLCPATVRLFKLPINCPGLWMQLLTEHTELRFISSGAATTHFCSFSPRFCLEAEQRYFMFTAWAN